MNETLVWVETLYSIGRTECLREEGDIGWESSRMEPSREERRSKRKREGQFVTRRASPGGALCD